MRSGTLDVPGIVGLGAATRIALAEREGETARLGALRDRLLEGLRAGIPDLFVNGPLEDRLPGNLNVGFPGTPADDVMALMRDVAVSTGSACSSNEPEPSHVLLAMGRSAEEAKASLRFGLGRFTTLEEIDRATASVIRAVASVRTQRKEVGLGP
jgi:cysteine desulfurase